MSTELIHLHTSITPALSSVMINLLISSSEFLPLLNVRCSNKPTGTNTVCVLSEGSVGGGGGVNNENSTGGRGERPTAHASLVFTGTLVQAVLHRLHTVWTRGTQDLCKACWVQACCRITTTLTWAQRAPWVAGGWECKAAHQDEFDFRELNVAELLLSFPLSLVKQLLELLVPKTFWFTMMGNRRNVEVSTNRRLLVSVNYWVYWVSWDDLINITNIDDLINIFNNIILSF